MEEKEEVELKLVELKLINDCDSGMYYQVKYEKKIRFGTYITMEYRHSIDQPITDKIKINI